MQITRTIRFVATLVVMAVAHLSWAGPAETQQTGTIEGTVRAASGAGLNGAQVSLPDLRMGTLAGSDGAFRIEDVPVGTHTLRAQILGYGTQSQQVTVRAGQVTDASFVLQQSAVRVEGLVATALGISREERSLGYSTDELAGEELAEVPTDNFSVSLTGKAAGLQIKDMGNIGGSTSVTLRGFNSISGTNQALFVVDGIPMNNESNLECNANCSGSWDGSGMPSGISSVDYGNGVSDLNSQDIESVSVLKGANAAALYGSRASNGVILVTTKKGEGTDGFRVTGSVSSTWSTPLQMRTLQNRHGGGQQPSDYAWVDGAGGGFNDGTDESWGPALDGTSYPQWFSESAPFLPSPYSPRKFYDTGRSSQANFSVAAAGDGEHLRVSGTYYDGVGQIPNSRLDRTTLSVAGGIDLTEDLSLTASGNYVKTTGEDRPNMVGFPDGFGVTFAYWQRQVDTERLKRAYDRWLETGEQPRPGHPEDRGPNWNHNFFDNPYYSTHSRHTEDARDRLLGSLQADYRINDWLSAMARVGTDFQNHRMYEMFPNSVGHPDGEYRNRDVYREETNTTVMLTSDVDLTSDVRLTARAGGALRRERAKDDIGIAQKLNVPGVYNLGNSSGPPQLSEFRSNKDVNSVFGLATLSYRNWAYIDASGRNDWSSTLPEGDNSYFYPSVSGSVILSDALDVPDFLSYAKIRASWAKTGSDAQPYQLRRTFQEGPFWEGTPSYTNPNALPASDLTPEEAESIEFGTELRIADDRGSLDLTYYKTNTRQQILPVDISHTTGFSNSVMNAGEVENKGFEATAGFDVLRDTGADELGWNVRVNFSTFSSRVSDLPEGVESIILGSTRGLTVEAREGEEYGAMLGQVTQTNDQGQELIGYDGRLIPSETKQVVGNFQPDFTAGLRNSFEYRGLRLSTLLDWRVGGDVFCQTCAIGRRTGQLIETLEGRDDFAIAHEGVHPDGTPNTVTLPPPVYNRDRYRMFHYFTYDASYLKLRELTMGFDLPEGIVAALPISDARLSVIGRDLLILSKNVPHIDPELITSSGNAQGIEVFRTPTQRSIGLRLSVRQ